jgi:hypothetical protein
MAKQNAYLKTLIAAFNASTDLVSVRITAEQHTVDVMLNTATYGVALDYADWSDDNILEVVTNDTLEALSKDVLTDAMREAVKCMVKGKWHLLTERKMATMGGYDWRSSDGSLEDDLTLTRETVLADGFTFEKLWLKG